MGFRASTWEILNKCLSLSGYLKNEKLPNGGTIIKDEYYFGREMLELGCQVFRRVKFSTSSRLSCDYFNSIGIKCLSVDLKKCGVSMVIDLRDQMPQYFYNRFDFVTNSGTTEHIETLDGQYEAFKNIHRCTKNGGIMLHFVPIKEYNPNHSPFFYTPEFFNNLSKLNNYKVIYNEKYYRVGKEYNCAACLQRQDDSDFTENKKEFLKYIYEK
jgi:SAM-dependent methyltransferase